MSQWIGPAPVQIMACRLFGAKPSSKPTLFFVNCALRSKLKWNLNQNVKTFHSWKPIRKYLLRNGGHFVRGGWVNSERAEKSWQPFWMISMWQWKHLQTPSPTLNEMSDASTIIVSAIHHFVAIHQQAHNNDQVWFRIHTRLTFQGLITNQILCHGKQKQLWYMTPRVYKRSVHFPRPWDVSLAFHLTHHFVRRGEKWCTYNHGF